MTTQKQHQQHLQLGNKALTLIICVCGLYGTFLTWSILQERINTKPYGDNNEYFKAPIIINLIQALFASIIGFIYNYVTTTTTSTKPQPKPNQNQ